MTDKLTYILDSGFFFDTKMYYPTIMPDFLPFLEQGFTSGRFNSTDGVREEIKTDPKINPKHLIEWRKNNKRFFTEPTPEDIKQLQVIFRDPKLYQRLREKSGINSEEEVDNLYLILSLQEIEGGERSATNISTDVFLLARAMALKGVVVTTEKKMDGYPTNDKLTSMCDNFSIKHLTPQEFMEEVGLRFVLDSSHDE